MFSEKDFERLLFLYKTEDEPKGVPSTHSALATTYHTRHSMTGPGRHRKKIVPVKVEDIPEELIRKHSVNPVKTQ